MPRKSSPRDVRARFGDAARGPGNIRELRNVVERAVILCPGPTLHIEPPTTDAPVGGTTLAEVERQHIQKILERTGGRIRGLGGAAELLGPKPNTLDHRIVKLGIPRSGRPGLPNR